MGLTIDASECALKWARESPIKPTTKILTQLLRCKMATRVFALTLVCFVVIISSIRVNGYIWPKKGTYSTRWDKVNIDEILESKRLLNYYFKCLMGTGPCPPDGRELKRVLPEALETACAKCTKSQIEGAGKVIRFLREVQPEKWKPLCGKYDPDGKYRQKYFGPPPKKNSNKA